MRMLARTELSGGGEVEPRCKAYFGPTEHSNGRFFVLAPVGHSRQSQGTHQIQTMV